MPKQTSLNIPTTKNMVEQSNQDQKKQSEQNTSTMSAGENLWERLQKMPYSRENIGKGFIMSSPLRKKDTPPSPKMARKINIL